jgi:hypothetical protein
MANDYADIDISELIEQINRDWNNAPDYPGLACEEMQDALAEKLKDLTDDELLDIVKPMTDEQLSRIAYPLETLCDDGEREWLKPYVKY